ncbi:MAG: hypothetical protein IPN20_25160 [Haliscomenobacter sp.]|nr:hypothetical protein [Haliscomenobacter sp.]
MKTITLILAIILTTNSYAQMGKVEELGFRHIKTTFRGDTIDILLKSKRGHEWINKPLLLFCQGSLPKPLIIKDGQTSYGVFPFNPDSLENYYHIAIISKPYVPIIADVKSLSQNFTYLDPITGKFPLQYSQKNHLDYYVDRNIQVIEYLQRQKYIAKSKLIVAGHSEGSTIAAKIATKTNKVTHLIYCSGNPFGRITTVIAQNRAIETDTDSTRYGEDQFEH